MNWLNEDWVIAPAGGVTGQAFVAQSRGEKIFIKRNSSPFLAVLSAEGIVPKLLWTKRLENEDVITAQKWLNGRNLKAEEMKSERVAKLLKRIHSSEPLVSMLDRLGKKPLTPKTIVDGLAAEAEPWVWTEDIRAALRFLERTHAAVDGTEKAVCHTDMNHNNWLLGEDGELYLVDWDHAVIADPALDLGMVLHWYVEESLWEEWLSDYGWPLSDSVRLRMYWYALARTLSFLLWNRVRERHDEARFYEKELARLMRYGESRFKRMHPDG